MCLICKPTTKFRKIRKEIVAYKVVMIKKSALKEITFYTNDYKEVKIPKEVPFLTPYKYKEVKLGEHYTDKFKVETHSTFIGSNYYKTPVLMAVEGGVFHLFKRYKDALEMYNENKILYNDTEIPFILKAVIPKGSSVIEGVSYVGNKSDFSPCIGATDVIYTEVIDVKE